jgi:hypothetical protein
MLVAGVFVPSLALPVDERAVTGHRCRAALSVPYARMDEPKALAGLDVERLRVLGHSSNGSAGPSTRVPDPERGGGSSLDGLLATSSLHILALGTQQTQQYSRESREDDSGTDRKPTDITLILAQYGRVAGLPEVWRNRRTNPSAAAGGWGLVRVLCGPAVEGVWADLHCEGLAVRPNSRAVCGGIAPARPNIAQLTPSARGWTTAFWRPSHLTARQTTQPS